jgi:hypothetical protein
MATETLSQYVREMAANSGYGPCECWTLHGAPDGRVRNAVIQSRGGRLELIVREGKRKEKGMKPLDTRVVEQRELTRDEADHVRREIAGNDSGVRLASKRIDAVRAVLSAG